MNVKWRSKEDEILIDFVRVHEMLFNVKHKDYRQTQMKQKLWCEVGEILNKTDTDCYKRWCYVRDYYIRRKGNADTSSSGEAAQKRSHLLSFLDSIPSTRRDTNTNVIEVKNPGRNTLDSIEQISFHNQETEDVTFNESTDEYHENKDGNMKNNRKRKNNLHSQEHLNQLKQIVNRNLYPLNELDETDLFFNSMAKIVKKLPRYEQAQIRMQIGSLVGNAELRYISIDSPPLSIKSSICDG